MQHSVTNNNFLNIFNKDMMHCTCTVINEVVKRNYNVLRL